MLFLGHDVGWDPVRVHGLPQGVPGGVPGRVRVAWGDGGCPGGDLGDFSQVISFLFLGGVAKKDGRVSFGWDS